MSESYTIKVSTGEITGGPLVATKEGLDIWRQVGASFYDKLPDLIEATRRNAHPNLMRIYWVFPTVGGTEFMIFYYKEEPVKRFSEWLEDNCFYGLQLSQQIELLKGLFEGVQHLHNHGLIHGDIKSGNIWVVLDERKNPKKLMLGDYKLIKIIGQNCEVCRFGTKGYVPYEYYLSDPPVVDVRYDIFGLAATVLSILTGGAKIPSDQNAEISADLYNLCGRTYGHKVADILAKAMSKRIEDRYPNVLQFWQSLKRLYLHRS